MSQTRLLGWGVGVGVVLGMAVTFIFVRPPHHRPPPWAKQLDLSKEQKDSIHQIFDKAHEHDRDFFKQLEDNTEALRKDLRNPQIGDDQLRQGFEKVNKLRFEAAQHRFEIDLQIRKIVGPDKMKFFDPMGPPPPPHGMHGGGPHPGGPPPDDFMGAPPPPPPDGGFGGPPPPPPEDHD